MSPHLNRASRGSLPAGLTVERFNLAHDAANETEVLLAQLQQQLEGIDDIGIQYATRALLFRLRDLNDIAIGMFFDDEHCDAEEMKSVLSGKGWGRTREEGEVSHG